MKPTVNTSRRVPEEKAATTDEIVEAFEALTPKQLFKLKQFARWRIRGLGRKSQGHNYEDLLQEAFMATLSDVRRWNKASVDFFGHLVGAMRSISWTWGKQFDPDEAILESEIIQVSSEGREMNPLLNVTTPLLDARRVVDATDYIEHIEMLVADRPLTSNVLQGMKEGMSGPEIKETLEITQTQLETEMRFLRRTARADREQGGE